MKQILLIAAIGMACNSVDNNSQPIKTDPTPVTVAAPDACSKLIFFLAGAEMNYKSYDAKGKEIGSQVTKGRTVKDQGGFTVASVESTDTARGNKTTVSKYDYKCNGKAIFFDIASLVQSSTKDQD